MNFTLVLVYGSIAVAIGATSVDFLKSDRGRELLARGRTFVADVIAYVRDALVELRETIDNYVVKVPERTVTMEVDHIEVCPKCAHVAYFGHVRVPMGDYSVGDPIVECSNPECVDYVEHTSLGWL